MRYISLFSGIEAASVAWEDLGWEPVAFSEIAPFPCEVLKQRFPSVPNLGDITRINWNEVLETYGTVDLVVGGSPCQSFSMAGGRESLDGESRLMFEFIRAVREIRPRYLLWENVPGCLSAKGQEGEAGGAFRQLLTELCDIGYGVAWRVLDAQFFGVAQRRRRVFLVGCLNNATRPGEILFERESLRWDTPSSRDKRKELAEGTERSTGSSYTMQVRCGCAGGGKGALIQEDMSATLSTSNVQTLFQPISPQCYAIQGDIARGAHMGQNGKGWSDEELSYTLNTMDHHAVIYPTEPSVCIAFSAGQSSQAGSIAAQEEVAPSLRASCSGSNQVPSICFTWNSCSGFSSNDDLSPTLRSARCGEPAVCMADANSNAAIDEELTGTLKVGGDPPFVVIEASNGEDVMGALCARDCKGVGSQYVSEGKVIAQQNESGYVVRRLMPIECERLQGFPDGWTDIEIKGKPASDSARYAALGNSIAVPVLAWIGKRIDEMEKIND